MCECMCACGDMICSRQLLSDWVWTTSGITPALLLNMLTTGCTYTSSQQTAFHAFPGIKLTCLTEKVIETKRECKWQTKHVEPKSESIDKIKQPNVCILHRHNEALIIIIKITEIVEETKKKKNKNNNPNTDGAAEIFSGWFVWDGNWCVENMGFNIEKCLYQSYTMQLVKL